MTSSSSDFGPARNAREADAAERATVVHGAVAPLAGASTVAVPPPGAPSAAALDLAELGVSCNDGLPSEAGASGGERLGPYSITGHLGAGGMGEVLEVYDARLGRRVAAKVALVQADPGALAKFVREAQITGQLDHPGVPPVHALGVTDAGRVYFTMKPVRGRDLASILDEERAEFARTGRGIRGWAALLRVFVDAADAVGFAHAKGLVHRDLKPANVMVGAFGEVYVMDWGLARVMGDGDGMAEPARVAVGVRTRDGVRGAPVATLEGSILGTPAYMPPEQARGEVSRVDARSDLYSLGAILYEMLSLAAPFDGDSALSVLAKAADEAPLPPSVRTPGRRVPWELEAIVTRAMARDPADRYADTAAITADVLRYLDGRRVAAARYGFAGLAWKWLGRHPQLAGGAALALTVAVAAWSLVAWRDGVRRDGLVRDAEVAAQRGDADAAFALLGQARALAPRALAVDAAVRTVALALLRERLAGTARPDELRRRWAELDAKDDARAVDVPSWGPDDDVARAARTATLEGYLAVVGWLDRALALAPDDAALRELRARAGEGLGWAALAGGDCALARSAFSAAVAFGEPTRGPELAACVQRDVERRLVRWERRAAAILEDMAGGLARPGRPEGAPLWDDYLIELASYRHPRVAAILERRLAQRLDEHEQGSPWTTAHRDEVRLACHALGRMGLAESVPALAAALARLRDPALVAEAGIALCNTRRASANAALVAARDRLGSTSEAWRQIARAFPRVPPDKVEGAAERDPEVWVAKGHELLAKLDPDAALAAYERALAIDADHAGALGGRGQARIVRGEVALGLADLDRALELVPLRPELHANRGYALHRLGRSAEAMMALDRALELDPACIVAYGNRSAVRLAAGDADGALADLDRAIELDPRAAKLWNARGAMRHERGDVAGAGRDFDRALELDPRSAEAWTNRGRARYLAGDAVGAIADFDRALELDPRSAPCLANRGLARAMAGDSAGALADYDQALVLDPRHVGVCLNRARARLATGDAEGARADAERAVELAPGATSPLVVRGQARLACGDAAGAIADYDQAIRQGARDGHVYYQRARACRELGDTVGAIADFDRALALDERMWLAWLGRGQALGALGRTDEGTASLRRARELAPEAMYPSIDHALEALAAPRR